MIEILELVHKNNFVHRDLSLDNWFLSQDEKQVFLNDWGCAVKKGMSSAFAGCLVFAPQAVLLELAQKGRNMVYTFQPKDDLEMIVKCLWAIMHRDFSQARELESEENHQALYDFWDQCLGLTFWKDLVALARLEEPKHSDLLLKMLEIF
jgi:serine/threonine protein kinase